MAIIHSRIALSLPARHKPATSGSLYSRVINGYLNAAAFASAPEAPIGTGPFDTDFGNSSVGLVRGPAQHNIDMAMERNYSDHRVAKVPIPRGVLQSHQLHKLQQPVQQHLRRFIRRHQYDVE